MLVPKLWVGSCELEVEVEVEVEVSRKFKSNINLFLSSNSPWFTLLKNKLVSGF